MKMGMRSLLSLALILFSSIASFSTVPSARYTTFPEAEETIRTYRDSGLPGIQVLVPDKWNRWIREQDRRVRVRIDRGIEDSISNLILYGTSFTPAPRIEDSADAMNSAAGLSSAARVRVHALSLALDSPGANERTGFVRDFVAHKQIPAAARERWLSDNLVRFIREQRDYDARLNAARQSTDPSAVFTTRSSLYAKRGLSVDTSLLPNFAIDETLQALAAKGVLRPGSVHRIAIIGPGLDFSDKRDGYDFYPLQTIQPFAIMESVLRLHLGDRETVRVTTFDLNPAVNAHIAALTAKARSGQSYVVQLPRDNTADWNSAALDYWRSFGQMLGTSVKALPVPDGIPSVVLRAVSIRADLAARITPCDLDIVAQTLDLPPEQRFDLVVATNILVYYNNFEQALAMANIAVMMKTGGIFLANNPLPSAHDRRLRYLGRKSIPFAANGEYGDDIVVYQRQ
jgi:hypothetical protein